MPYSFGETSRKNLGEAHPDLQTLFNFVIAHTDCKIIEGFRPQEEQDRAFELGRSRVKWPNSKHNQTPSMAVDVIPWPFEEEDWQDLERFRLFGAFVMWAAERLYRAGVISHRVIWGADWDDDGNIAEHNLIDYPHFQLEDRPS